MAEPTLLEFLDLDKLCNILNLKVAQRHSPNTIDTFLDTAKLVILWLNSDKHLGGHPSLLKAKRWCQIMALQVSPHLAHSQQLLLSLSTIGICLSVRIHALQNAI